VRLDRVEVTHDGRVVYVRPKRLGWISSIDELYEVALGEATKIELWHRVVPLWEGLRHETC